MCGFIFQKNEHHPVKSSVFNIALNSIEWRGPDAKKIKYLENNNVALGHCRLSILDLNERSDQPMYSSCGNFIILMNGEIYNYEYIRETLSLNCNTTSDTETVLEAYILIGNKIFDMLDGMFSIVIYDIENKYWVAARDAFGIKPLFIYKDDKTTVIGSEPSSIASIVNAEPCSISLSEWELIRRPVPGKSFFKNVDEIMPGTIIDSEGCNTIFWHWTKPKEDFNQEKFESLLNESIYSHELSDTDIVSLLSGGLDSAIIASQSRLTKCYTIGLEDNNEFEGAKDTADTIRKKLISIEVSKQELRETWKYLTNLRGEPLGLPNEGLIYLVCKKMLENEKVVLTGEGADELLFGYDGIFRWALNQKDLDVSEFLIKYGYSDKIESERLMIFLNQLNKNKEPIEFVEDFFYQVHLPGLLRRMDFASMAASKESRVPFVTKKLISYVYRQPAYHKINNEYSKIPIREYAKKLELNGALKRKKIGFSAQLNKENSRVEDYSDFRNLILEELKW